MKGEVGKQRIVMMYIITSFLLLHIISFVELKIVKIHIVIKIAMVLISFLYITFLVGGKYKEYEKQAKQEKVINRNKKIYRSDKKRIEQSLLNSTGFLKEFQYVENEKRIYVTNDEKHKYLKRLEEVLSSYNVTLSTLEELVIYFVDTIEKVRESKEELERRIGVHIYQDHHVAEIVNEFYDKILKYYYYLVEKSHMYVGEYQSAYLGLQGEERVSKELKLYDDILLTIPNTRFEVEGISVETDHFVLSPFGLFSIEVKNLGSSGKYSIIIEKDGRWLKKFPNGKTEIMENNITSQTYRHIALKQKLINGELKKRRKKDDLEFEEYLQIYPMIVIANDIVEIENYSDVPVLRVSNIYHHISKHSKHLSKDILNQVKDIIHSNTLAPKRYPMEDMEDYIISLKKELDRMKKPYDEMMSISSELLKNTEPIE